MSCSILSRLPVSALAAAIALALAASPAEAGTHKGSKVQGRITAVDLAASTITFTTKTGTVVLNVTASTKIEVNGFHSANLARIQAILGSTTAGGAKLFGVAYYGASTNNAVAIYAEEVGSGGSSSGNDKSSGTEDSSGNDKSSGK